MGLQSAEEFDYAERVIQDSTQIRTARSGEFRSQSRWNRISRWPAAVDAVDAVPDARVIKLAEGGTVPGYNVQIATDSRGRRL